jgi:hypothetical protein
LSLPLLQEVKNGLSDNSRHALHPAPVKEERKMALDDTKLQRKGEAHAQK